MQRPILRKSHKIYLVLGSSLLMALCFFSSSGWCQDAYRAESYHYNAAGKIDPFKPLVKAEVQKKSPAMSRLAPLQRYDVNQLKLVGIAGSGKMKVAMLLDAKGKSYVVSPGTLIGQNNGRIVQILDDQIVVEEKRMGDSKKTTLNRLTLKLYHYEDTP